MKGLFGIALGARKWICLPVLVVGLASCAIVPQNRRRYLVDPSMPAADDKLADRALRKFHTSREGAAGGDGKPAGGGCGCSN